MSEQNGSGPGEAALASLWQAARLVSARAYSPHSGFQVGAAVLDEQGRVHRGCNVESDSYGLTQCAERNALGAAVAAGVRQGQMTALVIYVPGERPLPPCGACRQVMMELLAEDALVVSMCDSRQRISWRCGELMPDAFRMDQAPGAA